MARAHESLLVDRIACTGHGLCAGLFPEQLTLDEWGYPIQADAPIPHPRLRHARRAVAACPALALRLETSTHKRAPTDDRSPNILLTTVQPAPHSD